MEPDYNSNMEHSGDNRHRFCNELLHVWSNRTGLAKTAKPGRCRAPVAVGSTVAVDVAVVLGVAGEEGVCGEAGR